MYIFIIKTCLNSLFITFNMAQNYHQLPFLPRKNFEVTKGEIRSCKSKKNRQHNCQKKKGQKDKQRSTNHFTVK